MTEQTGPSADPLRTDRITELDVALRDGGVLHVYDTGPSDDAATLPVLWHHGTPNTGHPPAPLFDTATALGLRWVGYDRPGYGGSTPAPDRPVSSAATTPRRCSGIGLCDRDDLATIEANRCRWSFLARRAGSC